MSAAAAQRVVGGAVDSFNGFTYSAACSEVEVDLVTGEVKILRSDERGLSGLFRFDAPATVQEVRRACEIDEITGRR